MSEYSEITTLHICPFDDDKSPLLGCDLLGIAHPYDSQETLIKVGHDPKIWNTLTCGDKINLRFTYKGGKMWTFPVHLLQIDVDTGLYSVPTVTLVVKSCAPPKPVSILQKVQSIPLTPPPFEVEPPKGMTGGDGPNWGKHPVLKDLPIYQLEPKGTDAVPSYMAIPIDKIEPKLTDEDFAKLPETAPPTIQPLTGVYIPTIIG